MMRIICFIMLGMILAPGVPAGAAFINLHGVNNCRHNPVVMGFDAGTYQVDPVGIMDGGAYDAVSMHYSWPDSWVHKYTIESSQFARISVSTGYRATPAEALANAISSSFTLTSPGNVSFYIWDGPNGYEYRYDNTYGVSLLVNPQTKPIPAPASVILVAIGTSMLGWLRRRRMF